MSEVYVNGILSQLQHSLVYLLLLLLCLAIILWSHSLSCSWRFGWQEEVGASTWLAFTALLSPLPAPHLHP